MRNKSAEFVRSWRASVRRSRPSRPLSVAGPIGYNILQKEGYTIRVVRLVEVSLVAVALLFLGLAGAAQPAQLAQPKTVIKVVPEKPTPDDEIKIELSGIFPNSCAPEAESVKVAVELNQVTINLANASKFCIDAEAEWSLSVPVGKKLAAGPYRVIVLYRMTEEPPDLVLGMVRFDVVSSGALGEQAGRQAAPIVPFTVLVTDQARTDGGTWTPGPLFANNLNSSKSNLNRTGGPLPATVGVPIGDVVALSNLNSSKSNLYRVAGCKAEDAKIIENCTPPFSPDKPTKVEITGPNPILTFLLEQTELPDLAVQINAIVRRYTEREEVFCDITVLTTVSNIGKGPAGVVALASNLNSSKSSIHLRMGMNSGGQATQVNIVPRLRPGQYLLEAEVQSLSLKESNDRNNRVTQAVTCR